jgi:hypothetical protein
MAKQIFESTIQQSGLPGHQLNWTYVLIPSAIAQAIKAGNKKEFKVKGKLDQYAITRISVFPAGDGNFVLPLNATMRKALGKRKGASLQVSIEEDKSEFVFNADFMDCLAEEAVAKTFFDSLTGSHQRYFSKWIDSAKTAPTREKRIAMAVNALVRKMGYAEMVRASQGKNNP